MNDLDQAIAAACEALANEAPTAALDAVRLDSALRDLLAALDAARGQAVVHLGRYFCDGPEGHFWCDSLTHARKFVDAVDADHEWTITTVAPPAALAVPDDRYTVDAVAWEEFIADWQQYVAGDPKMPFFRVREGLVAVIDSAQQAQQPAAAVPEGDGYPPELDYARAKRGDHRK